MAEIAYVISRDEARLIAELNAFVDEIRRGKFPAGVSEEIGGLYTLTTMLHDQLHERSEEDFRHDDTGDPERKYLSSIAAARSYMSLPKPRNLEKETIQSIGMVKSDEENVMEKLNEARHLLRGHSPDIIDMMASTHVGLGTDPERLDHHILNCKKQILDHSIFPTCLLVTNLHESIETVHTITRSTCLTKSNKIDFGLSGGYQGIHLGFEVVSETSKISKNQEIIGIADLRYQWAMMESQIRHEKLYKYITSDCRKAISGFNDNLLLKQEKEVLEKSLKGKAHDGKGRKDDNLCVDVIKRKLKKSTKKLFQVLSHFIEKYGTHVVLRCTFGFRLEKTQKEKAEEDFNLKAFKAGIMGSALGYASARAGSSKDSSLMKESAMSSSNVRSIGPVHCLVDAMTKESTNKVWMDHLKSDGDAGVISHDWTMMISNILRWNKSYKLASKRLQFWTHVRINDLRAGWTGGIYACSYRVKFKPNTEPKSTPTEIPTPTPTYGVCIQIEGYSSVHQPPSAGFVTNINSYDVETVNISTTCCGKKLNDVLEEFVLYRRFIVWSDDGKTGRVFVNKITVFHEDTDAQSKGGKKGGKPTIQEPTNLQTHFKLPVKDVRISDFIESIDDTEDPVPAAKGTKSPTPVPAAKGTKSPTPVPAAKETKSPTPPDSPPPGHEAKKFILLIDDARVDLFKYNS